MGLIKGTVGLVATIASAVVALLALAIVCYTATQLSSADISFGGVQESFCALGTKGITVGDISTAEIANSNCLFLEILGGITIAIGIVIGIIQCFTCNICGLGGILDLIFALLGSAAWLAASIIVTDVYKDTKSTDENAPYNHERYTVMIMCWVEFALFASIVLAAIMKCCGSRKAKKSGAV